jgi:hypothetical protein
MTEPVPASPMAGIHCPSCGAELPVGARYCWLCGASATTGPPKDSGKQLAMPAPEVRELNPWLVHTAIWGAVALTILVGIGAAKAADAKLTALFLAAAVPALLLTILGAAVGRASGRPWSPGAKLAVFFGAYGATIGAVIAIIAMAVLLVYSLFVALFEICSKILSGGG